MNLLPECLGHQNILPMGVSLATTATSLAATAALICEIFFRWHPAQLKRHPHILSDRGLNRLQNLLSVHELSRHGVSHKGLAGIFEILDLPNA